VFDGPRFLHIVECSAVARCSAVALAPSAIASPSSADQPSCAVDRHFTVDPVVVGALIAGAAGFSGILGLIVLRGGF
jgi:hypothetical protein